MPECHVPIELYIPENHESDKQAVSQKFFETESETKGKDWALMVVVESRT